MNVLTGRNSPSGVAYLIVDDIKQSTAKAEALGGVVLESAFDAQKQGRRTVIRASEALLVLRQKEAPPPANN